MLLKRVPGPALRPFVKTLWATDQSSLPPSLIARRERVLPTGDMHIAFRLSDHPLQLFGDVNDVCGQVIGHAVLGGPRAAFYLRDISEPVCSVGAQLHPGAAEILFGVTADELAGRHTLLDDLWGQSAVLAREQLLEARRPEHQLDLLESLLAARFPVVRGLHPAVAQALKLFATTRNVGEAVEQSGYSHRRFIALFRRAVGLTPKVFCRVLRFQSALDRVTANAASPWADLALVAGYSDQSHFNREFREFAGVTPEEYREISPSFAHHVPVPESTG